MSITINELVKEAGVNPKYLKMRKSFYFTKSLSLRTKAFQVIHHLVYTKSDH